MQHEGQSLGRGQPLKDDEQRRADRVRQQRLLLWVDGMGDRAARGSRLVQRLLASGTTGPQHVQADVRDDGRQPGPHVAHVADVARCSRSHASWTASSASDSEPSMR